MEQINRIKTYKVIDIYYTQINLVKDYILRLKSLKDITHKNRLFCYFHKTHFSFIMHAKPTRTFFWFPAFYFSRKIFQSGSISYFERNRVPNLGLKVSNRIFAMIDRVAKGHFKFKRKLRLPKFKFKQGIE